jgi:hypothetical protein
MQFQFRHLINGLTVEHIHLAQSAPCGSPLNYPSQCYLHLKQQGQTDRQSGLTASRWFKLLTHSEHSAATVASSRVERGRCFTDGMALTLRRRIGPRTKQQPVWNFTHWKSTMWNQFCFQCTPISKGASSCLKVPRLRPLVLLIQSTIRWISVRSTGGTIRERVSQCHFVYGKCFV